MLIESENSFKVDLYSYFKKQMLPTAKEKVLLSGLMGWG